MRISIMTVLLLFSAVACAEPGQLTTEPHPAFTPVQIATPVLPDHHWTLSDFTTDGCTVIEEGTKQDPDKWGHCCYEHDLAYWAGGTYSERRAADLKFMECIRDAGEPELAVFAYLGVRVGGSALVPSPYRWGYGWSGVRGYWPLTPAERAEVQRRTPAAQTARNP
ncbi:MAG TPA: hypothetical protein VFV50_18280 [Bdellovibrionales bacterium]|nr:hypothetical protein [Bdellovibrionales bacterium]